MTLKGFLLLLLFIAFLFEVWIIKIMHDIGMGGFKVAFAIIALATLFLLLCGLFVAVFMM